MKKTLFMALALVTFVASQVAAQNLADNPSFEDPTVDMGSANDVWFRFGSGANGTSSESTTQPRTGSRHIALQTGSANQFAGVFQNLNLAVSPGQLVTFSGYALNAAGIPFAATQEIKLEWQGTPNPPQNRLDVLTLGDTYSQFTHSGVAPAGTTGLVVTYAISTFGPGQGEALVYLDDMSVTIVPEPATLGLIATDALACVGLARRRK